MNDSQILLFVITSIFIILTPGQDMVLVMSRGMTQGVKAGIVTAAGVSVGLLGHTTLATLGLGTLLMASETLFTVLKVVGAAYLVYLGLRLIMSKSISLDVEKTQFKSAKKMFFEGAMSNISNPKITIFYFAFLPQFISSDVLNPSLYLLTLGLGFSVLSLLIKVPIGYIAGMASGWMSTRPQAIININRFTGTILIALGAKLALESR